MINRRTFLTNIAGAFAYGAFSNLVPVEEKITLTFKDQITLTPKQADQFIRELIYFTKNKKNLNMGLFDFTQIPENIDIVFEFKISLSNIPVTPRVHLFPIIKVSIENGNLIINSTEKINGNSVMPYILKAAATNDNVSMFDLINRANSGVNILQQLDIGYNNISVELEITKATSLFGEQ